MADRLCAVIVAAYKATRWIRESLDSIAAQEPLEGWRYETRVGVDGCEETSKHLIQARVPHWFSPVNLGPYLVRNALMRKPADAYAIFDADDVMRPAYLSTLLPLMGEGISGSARMGMGADGRRGTKLYPYVHGVSVFSAEAIEKLGGYRPWRIVADFDMIARAKHLRIPLTVHEQALFFRRDHPDQLTKLPETKIGSTQRKEAKLLVRRLIRRRDIMVQPTYAEMQWRPVPVEVAA